MLKCWKGIRNNNLSNRSQLGLDQVTLSHAASHDYTEHFLSFAALVLSCLFFRVSLCSLFVSSHPFPPHHPSSLRRDNIKCLETTAAVNWLYIDKIELNWNELNSLCTTPWKSINQCACSCLHSWPDVSEAPIIIASMLQADFMTTPHAVGTFVQILLYGILELYFIALFCYLFMGDIEKSLQLLLINDNLFAPYSKHSVICIVYINPQQEFQYCCVHWTRTEEKLKQFYKGWLGIQLPWQLLLIDCSLLLFIRRETVGERREKRRQGEVEGRKKDGTEREMVMETNRKDDSVIKKRGQWKHVRWKSVV